MSAWDSKLKGFNIGVKFLGIYWECWNEPRVLGDDESEFINYVKNKYRSKFGTRSFYIRPYYDSSTKYVVQ